jgi:hypothetical protein
MNDALRARLGAVAAALLVSGCGGGGQSAAPLAPAAGNTQSGTAAGSITARLSIEIPSGTAGVTTTAGRRAPQYLSSATAGLGIRAGAAGAASTAPWQLFNVAPNAAACSTTTAGLRTCVVSVSAPVVQGVSDEFQIEATDTAPSATSTQPLGNVLSSADVTQAVTAGSANDVNVALSGVIGSLAVSAARFSVWAVPGQSQSVLNIFVTANDYDGGAIAGQPQSFANPIVFSDGLGGSSPFSYPSASATVAGLPPPLVAGRIGAPIFYRAPTSGTAVSANVSVSTLVPTYLSLPDGAPGTPGPVASFQLDPMVVSVGGTPVSSITASVGGPDVTVTVTETGASAFSVQDPDNAFGDFTLVNAGGPVSNGTLVFSVHPVSATGSPVPTIAIADTTGTTATISVTVCPAAGCSP